MNKQTKDVKEYLSQPEIRMFLDALSLEYDLPADELAEIILSDQFLLADLSEFLQSEFNLTAKKADNFVKDLNDKVIAFFYNEDNWISLEPDNLENLSEEKNENFFDWHDFVIPKNLQVSLSDFNKIVSGDVARVRNYLWKSLGLEKAKEVVVVLAWLAILNKIAKDS